jgi:iron complex outermembrane receptor protein
MQTTGDGRFTSETLLGYNAGYRSLIARSFSLDVTAFFNQYNHLLSLEPAAPFTEDDQGTPATVYPFINGNGIKGTTAGFEIAADWKPEPWWRLESSWSYMRMNLHTLPTSLDTTTVPMDEGSSPHRQAQLQSYFDLSRNLEFSLTFRYVGALPYYLVSGYETGDARIAWRPVKHVEFAVTGQNLLQPRHFEYGGDPGPLIGIKRNVLASLTFRK